MKPEKMAEDLLSEELYLDEDFRMLVKTYPADVSAIGVTTLIDYVEALEAELAARDALIERLVEVGNDIVEEAQVQEPDVQELRDNWRVLISEWKAMKGGE